MVFFIENSANGENVLEPGPADKDISTVQFNVNAVVTYFIRVRPDNPATYNIALMFNIP